MRSIWCRAAWYCWSRGTPLTPRSSRGGNSSGFLVNLSRILSRPRIAFAMSRTYPVRQDYFRSASVEPSPPLSILVTTSFMV
jgi:hypothetical protein